MSGFLNMSSYDCQDILDGLINWKGGRGGELQDGKITPNADAIQALGLGETHDNLQHSFYGTITQLDNFNNDWNQDKYAMISSHENLTAATANGHDIPKPIMGGKTN